MFDYRPAPFWFLNHRLEKPELLRQLELMKDCGVSGFFMHPRAGLLTAYGSDEWFNIIGYIVAESKRLGLNAWLYDEDPFPSGMAGGRICFDHPEYAARALNIARFAPDASGKIFARVGTGRLLSAIAVRTDESGAIAEERDVSGAVGVIRPQYFKRYINSTYYTGMYGKLDHVHPRAETFYPALWLDLELPAGETGWRVFVTTAETVMSEDKYGILPDCMNRDAVKAFIELTHDKYKCRVGAAFGGTVPGIFTDEPAAGWGLPWTEGFEAEFEKTCGYKIEQNHHHLKGNFGEKSRRVRRDYWHVVTSMYEAAFFGQLNEWCTANSLKFTGHVIGEEDPLLQLYTGGNAFRAQRFFDIPGFDVVGRYTADHDHPSLAFGGKLISSAASVFGKKQVACEFLACNAFNFGPAGMLKMAGWLLSLGISWLVPHGFYYSIDGDRKFDAGKSFFFQDPAFPEFPRFASFAARMGEMLAEAEYRPSYYLLYPVTAFRSLIPAENKAAEALRDRMYADCMSLFEAHVEFTVIDDITLAEKFGGGAADLPVISTEGAAELISGLEHHRFVSVADALNDASAERTHIKCPSADASAKLHILRKHSGDDVLIYVFNNSPDEAELSPVERCSGIYFYDAFTGRTLDCAGIDSFMIGGYESMLLIVSDRPVKCDGPYMRTVFTEDTHAYETSPQWNYTPPIPFIAAIDKWDACVITSDGRNMTLQDKDFCLVRDITGTDLRYMPPKFPRPSLDGAEIISSPYPAKAAYTANFDIGTLPAGKLSLLFEGGTFNGACTISLNGQELDKAGFTRRTIYDSTNLIADITNIARPGQNVLSVQWHQAGEFDGIRSSVYVITEY